MLEQPEKMFKRTRQNPANQNGNLGAIVKNNAVSALQVIAQKVKILVLKSAMSLIAPVMMNTAV